MDAPCFIHELTRGRFLAVNRLACELLGYTREEMLDLTVADVETRFKLTFLKSEWEKTEAGIPSFYEGIARKKDGTTLPVDIRVGLFMYGNERLAFAKVMDSTLRHAREDALKTERERFFRVLDGLPGYVCLKAPDLTITFANNRFRELFGDSEGKTCYQVLHGRDEQCPSCPARKVFDTGVATHGEWRGPGGRIYEIDHLPFGDPDEEFLVLEFGLDITERKVLWEQLRKTNEKLEATVEQRSEQLRLKAADLEESNRALKFLLKQRDLDREELEQSVLSNLENRVFPILESLRGSNSGPEHASLIDRLEHFLREMTSPFIRKLSGPLLCLTPTEIRVCDLVREGKGTKDISRLLNISEKGVLFHRQNVRSKLGIKGRQESLRSHLLKLR